MLESHDDIIGVSDDNHVAGRRAPSPALDPVVEHIVQIHVREQR
jgi:hypothetical protein